MHIREEVLDENAEIDVQKIDLVGRHGGNYYVRAHGEANFIVPKPLAKPGIGIDALPEKIKHHRLLSGNDLGQLGNLSGFPDEQKLAQLKAAKPLNQTAEATVSQAKSLISENKTDEALALLMAWL
jgi:hypothetical protein